MFTSVTAPAALIVSRARTVPFEYPRFTAAMGKFTGARVIGVAVVAGAMATCGAGRSSRGATTGSAGGTDVGGAAIGATGDGLAGITRGGSSGLRVATLEVSVGGGSGLAAAFVSGGGAFFGGA